MSYEHSFYSFYSIHIMRYMYMYSSFTEGSMSNMPMKFNGGCDYYDHVWAKLDLVKFVHGVTVGEVSF